jgi:ABC-2 type transport system permease protein
MAQGTMRITSGPAAGTELAVDDKLLIGRAADGDGTLAGDPELSRQHARITRANGALMIEDLGSTNGTSVNGERISGPRELRAGDTVSVGSSTMEVLGPPPQPAGETVGSQHTVARPLAQATTVSPAPASESASPSRGDGAPADGYAFPKFAHAADAAQTGGAVVAKRRANPVSPLVGHNLKLLLGDPGPVILYLAIPVLSILVMRPTMKTILVQEGFTDVNGSEQAVPGFMIMFMFLWVITLGRGFFIEHGWNTWERLRASQASMADIVAGKLIPGALLIGSQIVITMAIGVTLFGMVSKGPLLVLLIPAVPLVTCVLALTAMIVALIQTYAQLEAIGNLILIVFAAMGGALTPVASLPPTIRAIGHAFPSYWALKACRNVILLGDGLSGVLVPAAVLAGMTVVCGVIAMLRFSSSQAKRIEI